MANHRYRALVKRNEEPMDTISTSVQHVEVAVRDLHLGMYVSELDIPWLESPFLFQGFVIESREQLDQLNQ